MLFRSAPEALSDEIREDLIMSIKNFIKDNLKDYYLQPYWDISKGKKKHKIKIYQGGEIITDKRTLLLSMEIGIISGEMVKSRLPFPHDLEYEKTFDPLLLLSKKRYVGILYEKNPNKGKRKEMGIVLKRRDNAPIVKDVYGGLIDILMKSQNIPNAIAFVKKCLQDIVEIGRAHV